MKNIEIKLKSLITKEEYFKLLYYFNDLFAFRGEENLLIYIYESNNDIRIEQTNQNGKIIFKDRKYKDINKGNIIIKFNKDDFLLFHKLIKKLGLKKKIEWHKKSLVFKFKNIDIYLEHTKGYGYVLKMRIITTDEFRGDAERMLKDKFKEFEVELCGPEVFSRRREQYKRHWREAIK